jgi:hypothetical protein
MQENTGASNEAAADDIFNLETPPGVAELDRIEGYEPKLVPIESSAERYKLRDSTLDASETATLFNSVSSTHPLEEEQEDEDGEHEDEKGDPVSPYATLFALAALKSGRIKHKKAFGGQTDRLRWSRKLRPMLISHVAESRGWRLREPEWSYLHADVSRMSCSVQWEADVDGSGLYVPLEPKIVAGSERWKWQNAAGEYVIPIPTMIRVQHVLSVTGCRRAMVLALFGGYEERVFEIVRDEALIAEIEAGVNDFWALLDKGEMPQPDYGRDTRTLQMLYAKIDPEKMLDWTGNNAAKVLLARKAHHASQENFHKGEAKKCNDALWEMLGDASGANLGDAILGVSVVEGAEVKYYRDTYKKLSTRKPRDKHAGSATRKKSKKEN